MFSCTAVSTFFRYRRISFFPVRPCQDFFLYGRLTFSCTTLSPGVYTHIALWFSQYSQQLPRGAKNGSKIKVFYSYNLLIDTRRNLSVTKWVSSRTELKKRTQYAHGSRTQNNALQCALINPVRPLCVVDLWPQIQIRIIILEDQQLLSQSSAICQAGIKFHTAHTRNAGFLQAAACRNNRRRPAAHAPSGRALSPWPAAAHAGCGGWTLRGGGAAGAPSAAARSQP